MAIGGRSPNSNRPSVRGARARHAHSGHVTADGTVVQLIPSFHAPQTSRSSLVERTARWMLAFGVMASRPRTAARPRGAGVGACGRKYLTLRRVLLRRVLNQVLLRQAGNEPRRRCGLVWGRGKGPTVTGELPQSDEIVSAPPRSGRRPVGGGDDQCRSVSKRGSRLDLAQTQSGCSQEVLS